MVLKTQSPIGGKTKGPDMIAYTVSDDEENARWKNLGVAFYNEKSKTFTILLDALPVNGKIILKEYVPKED